MYFDDIVFKSVEDREITHRVDIRVPWTDSCKNVQCWATVQDENPK